MPFPFVTHYETPTLHYDRSGLSYEWPYSSFFFVLRVFGLFFSFSFFFLFRFVVPFSCVFPNAPVAWIKTKDVCMCLLLLLLLQTLYMIEWL